MGYRTISKGDNIISLEKIKEHCFVYGNEDDDLLQIYLSAACQRFTQQTGVVINPETIECKLDCFENIVRLYRSPITEIVSISYNDTSGELQTIDVDSVAIDTTSRPARLALKNGNKWPNTDRTPGNVSIVFKAGHNSVDDLPELIEWAILTMVAHMYENREEISSDNKYIVPSSAQMVLNMFEIKEV